VHRVAAVEVVRVVHRVVVLRAVRVGAVHVGEVELQVHGEGAVHGRTARDAGVDRGREHHPAVVPEGQRLRVVLVGQRVGVAVRVVLALGHRGQQVGPHGLAGVPVHGQSLYRLEGPDRPGVEDVGRACRPLVGQVGRVVTVPAERARGCVVRGGQLGVGVLRADDRAGLRRPGERQVAELREQLLQAQGAERAGGEALGHARAEQPAGARAASAHRDHPGLAARDLDRDLGVLEVTDRRGEHRRVALHLPLARNRGRQLRHRGAGRQRRGELHPDRRRPVHPLGPRTRANGQHLQRNGRHVLGGHGRLLGGRDRSGVAARRPERDDRDPGDQDHGRAAGHQRHGPAALTARRFGFGFGGPVSCQLRSQRCLLFAEPSGSRHDGVPSNDLFQRAGNNKDTTLGASKIGTTLPYRQTLVTLDWLPVYSLSVRGFCPARRSGPVRGHPRSGQYPVWPGRTPD
jgi:hypothetical protein